MYGMLDMFSRFQLPDNILKDHGSVFMSKVMTQLGAKQLGAKKKSYNP